MNEMRTVSKIRRVPNAASTLVKKEGCGGITNNIRIRSGIQTTSRLVSSRLVSSLGSGYCWKGLDCVSVPNRFRINLCAPFSEIWARRVHDICLDRKLSVSSRKNAACFQLSTLSLSSLYLHKIKHPPRRANKFRCEPSQTIIACTNSFAALLSHAINAPRTDGDAISDKCSQIRQTVWQTVVTFGSFSHPPHPAPAAVAAVAALRLWHNCYVIVELSRIANCEKQPEMRTERVARQTRI